MEHTFHIQDPTDPNTVYLHDAIAEQVRSESLRRWRGIFAFATGNAVRSLFLEDSDVETFAHSGEISFVVGIDSVTDVSALEELAKLSEAYDNFEAKVFFNPGVRLFHPKISHFSHNDGSSVLIVGSGNLTPGGLRKNIEAYSVIVGDDKELDSLAAWDRFLSRHFDNIRTIDEEAMRQARANRAAFIARQPRVDEVEPDEPNGGEKDVGSEDKPELPVDSKILVAQVPKGGGDRGRWSQIHYNKNVVDEFFRIATDNPDSTRKVYLREVHTDGTTGPVEPRHVIYSTVNKNYKIEASAARGKDYPASPPIMVLRETAARNFDYTLLLPDDNGYEDMMNFTETRPPTGRGHKRIVSTYDDLRRAWPDCPL